MKERSLLFQKDNFGSATVFPLPFKRVTVALLKLSIWSAIRPYLENQQVIDASKPYKNPFRNL